MKDNKVDKKSNDIEMGELGLTINEIDEENMPLHQGEVVKRLK